MQINSLNRIESATQVLAFPSDLMSKLDPKAKQSFIKVCLALGITNDTDFEKIPSGNFKRGALKKLLNQYGEWFVIVGITNDGMPWYSYFDQKMHKQIILPKAPSVYALVDNTAALYVAHGGQELADRVAQQKAERAANKSFEFRYGRNKIDDWSQKYLDKSGYQSRPGSLKDRDVFYGLRKDQLQKYYEIIEKDPEGKLDSLRKQYISYLKNATNAAISSGFSDKSLDNLHMVVRVCQDMQGSMFEYIESTLKAGAIGRAAEYMFDLQVRLERYKRTGRV